MSAVEDKDNRVKALDVFVRFMGSNKDKKDYNNSFILSNMYLRRIVNANRDDLVLNESEFLKLAAKAEETISMHNPNTSKINGTDVNNNLTIVLKHFNMYDDHTKLLIKDLMNYYNVVDADVDNDHLAHDLRIIINEAEEYYGIMFILYKILQLNDNVDMVKVCQFLKDYIYGLYTGTFLPLLSYAQIIDLVNDFGNMDGVSPVLWSAFLDEHTAPKISMKRIERS